MIYLWFCRCAIPPTGSRAPLFLRTRDSRFHTTFATGAIAHRRITPLTARVTLLGCPDRRAFGFTLVARTSTSPHRVGGSIFDHELASIELVVLGVYQSGGCTLYAREIDKRESGTISRLSKGNPK